METHVESPVVFRAQRAGWFVRKLEWVGRKGAPDRIFIKTGRIVFIEFKDRGKEPTLLQLEEHRFMREAGAEVHVCDTPSQALKILGIT